MEESFDASIDLKNKDFGKGFIFLIKYGSIVEVKLTWILGIHLWRQRFWYRWIGPRALLTPEGLKNPEPWTPALSTPEPWTPAPVELTWLDGGAPRNCASHRRN